MLARNALALVVATALTAAVAGAQQPKSTTPAKSSATQQAPAKTSTAKAPAISADSAKKIVAANEAGATVTSAKLHHASGKAYYEVHYKMKGDSKSMKADVDANTGEFTQKPASTSTKSSSKKSS